MTRLAALLLLLAWPAFGEEPHLVPATVLRVTDGDTVRVLAYPWPGQTNEVSIRLRNVDTPELDGPCEALALAAKKFVQDVIGESITIRNPELGKYAGRITADVITEGGEDLGELLLVAGLGRPYNSSGGKYG